MQFMVIRKADERTEAGVPPTLAALDEMEHFNAQLAQAGAVGLALGLRPSSRAVRLAISPDGATVTDGPFAEAKELVAGFTIFEAPSKEAAIEQLKRWPQGDVLPTGEAVLELRETGCAGGCTLVPPPVPGEGARYLILLRSNDALEREDIPPRAVLDKLDAFNAAQVGAGVLLAGDGLRGTSRGARLKLSAGGASVIDGPFAEAKELIAGFWMIRAHSMADAVAWARTVPYPTGPWVEVEIREAATMADLMPALDDEQRRADASLRAEQLDDALRKVTARA